MNIRLKMSVIELLALRAFLIKSLRVNINNALFQKYIGNIFNNIEAKRKNIRNIIDSDMIEIELSLLNSFQERQMIDIKTEPCSRCHFYKNDECLKKKDICNFFGYSDAEFESFYKAYQRGTAEDCIQFQYRKFFVIKNINMNSPTPFEIAIIEDGEIEAYRYNIQSIRLWIHKYGEDAFVNLEQYRLTLEKEN